MAACPACGFIFEGSVKFCTWCGAPLRSPARPREQRKTVTVLFCDLTGSTALGERLDPEALRLLLNRYFERMKAIVERHGGRVDKFIGDAVVAVFGVPIVHEDDALRAVRAAVEMRSALPELDLDARFGVNTGEVMTGGDERLTTGDAVNVAARLQQAAAPGEVLLGAETYLLVRDAVGVEDLPGLELKGKQQPVSAVRLLAVEPASAGVARHLDAPIVGRDRELRLLAGAFEGTVVRRGCGLFTLLGVAGVGKSRLVREFVSQVDARAVEGRCLSYGEGITYLPVVEIVEQLGGANEKLLADSPGAATTIGALLGEQDAATTPEEIAWALRKLLEAAAAERPLVVVFDDIHWGEPTLLDLVEQIADLSREAPILLVCMARPELLDRRPAWGGGKLNATAIMLEPLDAGESDELMGQLLGGESIEPGLAARVRAAAEGNPLFLEEMLALVRESHERELVVPATIKALLAARLDQLVPDERSVLERGSVEGQLFHSAAVIALAGEPAPIERELQALIRKELVRPAQAEHLQIGDAYRFRHLLIRDAAYDALPKASRAELHERFADWLAEDGRDLVGVDEIVGYHLEQSHRYRAELGAPGAENALLGERAAARLASAGNRAMIRGDLAAAANLLERALALGIPDPRERARLQVDLGEAFYETGRSAQSEEIMTVALDAATGLGEHGLAARAAVQRAFHGIFLDLQVDLGAMEAIAGQAIGTLEELDDPLGLALAERLLGQALTRQGRWTEGLAAVERAAAHAEASGDQTTRRDIIQQLCSRLVEGPVPAAHAIGRLEELLQSTGDDRVLQAVVSRELAAPLAMAGRFDDAREHLERSAPVLDELDLVSSSWMTRYAAAEAKELIGDRVGAEQELTALWRRLSAAGGGATESRALRAVSLLALLYCDAGRWDEAAECLSYGQDVPEPTVFHHLATVLRTAAKARITAHRGERTEALRLGQLAVKLADSGGFLNVRASIWFALADVHRHAGQTAEADVALAVAHRLYTEKGNLVAAARLQVVNDSPT